MIKIGKYSVVQSGNFLLQENIPLSVECDGIHIEIMYMESNESSLYIVNKRYWKKLLIRTVFGENTYSPSQCLIQEANGKEYYLSFILTSAFNRKRNFVFNLLRN